MVRNEAQAVSENQTQELPSYKISLSGVGGGGGRGGGERVDYTISSLIPAVITDNHYQNLTVII